MRFYVNRNNVISMIKGDTTKVPVELKRGSFPYEEPFELGDNDELYFALFDSKSSFDCPIIKKVLTKEDYTEDRKLYFVISPFDTADLNSGVYYYEIKLLAVENENVIIETIIPTTKFIISE